jgi:K+-sensing histidine kinase KdpD
VGEESGGSRRTERTERTERMERTERSKRERSKRRKKSKKSKRKRVLLGSLVTVLCCCLMVLFVNAHDVWINRKNITLKAKVEVWCYRVTYVLQQYLYNQNILCHLFFHYFFFQKT